MRTSILCFIRAGEKGGKNKSEHVDRSANCALITIFNLCVNFDIKIRGQAANFAGRQDPSNILLILFDRNRRAGYQPNTNL